MIQERISILFILFCCLGTVWVFLILSLSMDFKTAFLFLVIFCLHEGTQSGSNSKSAMCFRSLSVCQVKCSGVCTEDGDNQCFNCKETPLNDFNGDQDKPGFKYRDHDYNYNSYSYSGNDDALIAIIAGSVSGGIVLITAIVLVTCFCCACCPGYLCCHPTPIPPPVGVAHYPQQSPMMPPPQQPPMQQHYPQNLPPHHHHQQIPPGQGPSRSLSTEETQDDMMGGPGQEGMPKQQIMIDVQHGMPQQQLQMMPQQGMAHQQGMMPPHQGMIQPQQQGMPPQQGMMPHQGMAPQQGMIQPQQAMNPQGMPPGKEMSPPQPGQIPAQQGIPHPPPRNNQELPYPA